MALPIIPSDVNTPKWNQTNYKQFKGNKQAATFIDLHVPFLHNAVKCRMCLLTCTFATTETTMADSWNLVKIRRDNFLKELLSHDRISYVISSVEQHPIAGDESDPDTPPEKHTLAGTKQLGTDGKWRMYDDRGVLSKKPVVQSIIDAGLVGSKMTDEKGKTRTYQPDGNLGKVERKKKKASENTSGICSAPVKASPLIKQVDTDDAKRLEVERFFIERDEYRNIRKVSPKVPAVRASILTYAYLKIWKYDPKTPIVHTIHSMITGADPSTGPDIPLDYYPGIYQYLYQDGGETYLEGSVIRPTTLEGYAHIHMAIAVNSRSGDFTELDKPELQNMCSKYFLDVNVRRNGKTVDVSQDSGIIKYVLKNANFSVARDLLGEYPATLHASNKSTGILEFYSRLTSTGLIIGGVTALPTSTKPQAFPLNRPEEYVQVVLGDGTPYDPDLKIPLSLPKHPGDEYINYMITHMLDNQRFVEEGGHIYSKVPGSRFTWSVHDKIRTPEHLAFKSMVKDNYAKYKVYHRLFTDMCRQVNTIFPAIIIDYDWVEFKDCFLQLSTGRFVKDQNIYPSFVYLPKFEYSMLLSVINGTNTPDMWLSILKNSKLMSSENNTLTTLGVKFIRCMYSIMLKKTCKDPTPALYGDSNAGKSSVVNPILGLYPESVIARITAAGGFELSILPGKLKIFLDEFSLLNTGLNRENLLLVTDGGAVIASNKKNQDPFTIKNYFRTVITSNDIDWAYEKQTHADITSTNPPPRKMDPAIVNRMEFFRMIARPEAEVKTDGRDEMTEKEQALIVVYLCVKFWGIVINSKGYPEPTLGRNGLPIPIPA